MPDEQPKSAIDQFLSDIPTSGNRQSDDLFDKPLTETPASEEEASEDSHKNRRHRRLEAKLQAEREYSIQLAARLEALTEVQRFAKDTNADNLDENLKRLYGTDEKGLAAAKITQELLRQTEERAKQAALEEISEKQDQEVQEVARYRDELHSYLEEIEDEFEVDLTSDTPAALRNRQGFFALFTKVSPKDSDGDVSDYADPVSTWELYQSQQKPESTRAKDLGSRSMVRSGNSSDSKLEQTSQERWLRENGII